MKALLLRVGADTGNVQKRAPIFEDGSFEYIPIPEDYPDDKKSSIEKRTYGKMKGRNGKPFIEYLRKTNKNKLFDTTLHFDPEFETCTYGDPSNVKRGELSSLKKNDIIVFYAGLEPYKTDKYETGCYIIGYFTLREVIDFKNKPKEEIISYYNKYPNNAHSKRYKKTREYEDDLLLFIGYKNKSRVLDKAIYISKEKKKNGVTGYNVSNEIEKLLGIKGSIKMSTHIKIIDNDKKINNLKQLLDSN